MPKTSSQTFIVQIEIADLLLEIDAALTALKDAQSAIARTKKHCGKLNFRVLNTLLNKEQRRLSAKREEVLSDLRELGDEVYDFTMSAYLAAMMF